MGKKSRKNQNRPPKHRKIEAPDFPTQAHAEAENYENPRNFLSWALAGLPHMKGAPLAFPTWYMEEISKQLWDIGFRFHPELQKIKYRKPHAGQGPFMLMSGGTWVDIDEDDEEPANLIDMLTEEQRKDVAEKLGFKKKDLLPQEELTPLGVNKNSRPKSNKILYKKADGTTVMLTPEEARRWLNAKRARQESSEAPDDLT